MKREEEWKKELTEGNLPRKGRHGGSKHRKSRMLKFGHKHASAKLKKKLVKNQQRREKKLAEEKLERRKIWHGQPDVRVDLGK